MSERLMLYSDASFGGRAAGTRLAWLSRLDGAELTRGSELVFGWSLKEAMQVGEHAAIARGVEKAIEALGRLGAAAPSEVVVWSDHLEAIECMKGGRARHGAEVYVELTLSALKSYGARFRFEWVPGERNPAHCLTQPRPSKYAFKREPLRAPIAFPGDMKL